MAVLAVLGVSAPAAQATLSVPSVTYISLTAFENAAGGGDNGTTAGEQGSGFRHWSPAGIAVNGSDPGSTAIPGGHTAGPLWRSPVLNPGGSNSARTWRWPTTASSP